MPLLRSSGRPPRLLAVLLLAVLCGSMAQWLASTPSGRHLEELTYDWRLRLPLQPTVRRWRLLPDAPVHPDLIIVGLDRQTYATLREPSFLWNQHLARAIDAISAAGPRAIGLDRIQPLAFTTHGPLGTMLEAGDEALAQAVADASGVVAAYAVRPLAPPAGSATAGEDASVQGQAVHSFFHNVLPAEALGMTNLLIDTDGICRRHAWMRTWQQSRAGTLIATPTFALALLTRATGATPRPADVRPGQPLQVGPYRIPWDAAYTTRIRYAGPGGQEAGGQGRTFPYVSLCEVLTHAAGKDLRWLRERFRARIVLIGESDALMHTEDMRLTPFSVGATQAAHTEAGQMQEERSPGVEVHANIINTVLTGRVPQLATPSQRGLCLLGALGLVAALLSALPARSGSLLLLLCAAGYAWTAAWAMARHDLILPVATPLLAGAAFAAALLALRVGWGERQAREVRAIFARYVHPKVVDDIIANPEAVQLGGTKLEATIMFTDLNDFTTMSHTMEPTAVVALLNAYFERMTAIILAHGGTIQAFLGDGLMIVYNAPLPQEDHALRALLTARAMMADMGTWMEARQQAGLPTFWMKVGIHTGEVVVGNIGSTLNMAYTAIGDACNVASRTMDATKRLRADILVGARTFELTRKSIRYRAHPGVLLKGIEEPVTLYEVDPEPGR